MSKKLPGRATEIELKTSRSEPASISRRSLLKKSIYHAPALLILGSLVSVGKANDLSFPFEPGPNKRPPGPDNRPPGSGNRPPGD